MAWNAKKTHKIFFSSEQLLPQTGPESDGPGREYLDNLGPGRPFSGMGHVINVQSHFHKIAILKSSLVGLASLVSQ